MRVLDPAESAAETRYLRSRATFAKKYAPSFAASDAGRITSKSVSANFRYNPLHNGLDAYSLAYGIASLINNLFGRGKEPFWQQAYTNLVKFIILQLPLGKNRRFSPTIAQSVPVAATDVRGDQPGGSMKVRIALGATTNKHSMKSLICVLILWLPPAFWAITVNARRAFRPGGDRLRRALQSWSIPIRQSHTNNTNVSDELRPLRASTIAGCQACCNS